MHPVFLPCSSTRIGGLIRDANSAHWALQTPPALARTLRERLRGGRPNSLRVPA